MVGRAEHSPKDICMTDPSGDVFYKWGYFFIKPRAGNKFNDSEYSDMVSKAAFSAIGKRTSPKDVRDMWATWAFQVGLSDAQIQSLAYCMGHDVKTLREIYDRCSPEEKRRPIEEAIDELLVDVLKSGEEIQSSTNLEDLARNLLQLPEEDFETLATQYLGMDFNEFS
jgi:integrase